MKDKAPKRARVYNDNPHTDWKENWNGDEYVIKSGGFIEMGFYEAHEFKGQFSPIIKKGDNTFEPKSLKMIRVEPIFEADAKEDEGMEIFPCMICKKVFTTEAALMKHSIAEHADRMVTDEEAEAHTPKKRGRPPTKAQDLTAE